MKLANHTNLWAGLLRHFSARLLQRATHVVVSFQKQIKKHITLKIKEPLAGRVEGVGTWA